MFAAADALRREVSGDVGQLRRHAEHPVHERLLLPLRLLRLLEGASWRRTCAARRYLVPHTRSPAGRGGLGARRDGGLPAGRHPPELHRRLLLSVVCARSRPPCRRSTCTRSRALEIWQGATTLGAAARELPRAAERRRASARCRGRQRRSSTTRCAQSSAPTRSRPRSGSRCTTRRTRRAALERHDHVRPRRAARALGAPPARGARRCSAHRRLHRVRAAAVRAHGSADVPARAAHAGARRSREALLMHAVGRLALHPQIDEHSGLVGQAGPRRASRQALRAGVNDLGGTLMNESISRAAGAEYGPGAAARADGGADPLGRPRAAPAHDALRRGARRASGAVVRGSGARGAAQPACERGAAGTAAAARSPRAQRLTRISATIRSTPGRNASSSGGLYGTAVRPSRCATRRRGRRAPPR